jgi:hypothetical protein
MTVERVYRLVYLIHPVASALAHSARWFCNASSAIAA